MIINETVWEATFVNQGHTACNQDNVEAIVNYNVTSHQFDFKVGYRIKALNNDILSVGLYPIVNGHAKVMNDNQITGRTNDIPKQFNNPRGIRDTKIGLLLIKNNLPKYNKYILAHMNVLRACE